MITKINNEVIDGILLYNKKKRYTPRKKFLQKQEPIHIFYYGLISGYTSIRRDGKCDYIEYKTEIEFINALKNCLLTGKLEWENNGLR